MKNMINTLMALTALFTMSACTVVDEQDPKLEAWNSAKVTRRSADGKEVPTAYIFDCRKVTEAKNVHFYYSLIADPKGVESRNHRGEKVTTYNNAELGIIYTANNYGRRESTGYTKGVLSVDVDFQIIENSRGYSEAIVTANESTIATLREYYKNNPYFNHVKVGDELLRLQSNPFSRMSTNVTEVDMPGITKGDQLECR
jgi:hypothetical protein